MYTLELYQGGDMNTPAIALNVGRGRDNARGQFVAMRARFQREDHGTDYRLVLRNPEGEVELSYEPKETEQ